MAEMAFGPGLRLGGEVVPQFSHLGLDVRATAAQPQQGGPGLVGMPVPGQPARRLGQQEHADGQHDAGHAAQPQHPPPGGVGGQGIADQVGAEDAQRDGELVAGHERSTLLRRGDLGQVQRRQHGGAADADTHQHASGEQHGEAWRQGRYDSARDEDHRRRQQDRPAAEPVGQAPGERRPEGGAPERDAGDDAEHQGGEVERRPQEQQRPRDDARIIPEQQATQGGRRSN